MQLYPFWTLAVEGGGWLRYALTLYTWKGDWVSIARETEWAMGTVRMGPKNLICTGFRTPDRQFHSKSLHRLIYPSKSHSSYYVTAPPLVNLKQLKLPFP